MRHQGPSQAATAKRQLRWLKLKCSLYQMNVGTALNFVLAKDNTQYCFSEWKTLSLKCYLNILTSSGLFIIFGIVHNNHDHQPGFGFLAIENLGRIWNTLQNTKYNFEATSKIRSRLCKDLKQWMIGSQRPGSAIQIVSDSQKFWKEAKLIETNQEMLKWATSCKSRLFM